MEETQFRLEELARENERLRGRLQILERWRDAGPMRGVQVAEIVGGAAGEPAVLDKYGRAPIKMNWDPSQSEPVKLNAKTAGSWLAAQGGGMQFLPRAGQRVFVTFEHGDPERPVIVGYVGCQENPLPYPSDKTKAGTLAATQAVKVDSDVVTAGADYNPATEAVNKSVIRTVTTGATVGGVISEIAFVDEKDKEALTLGTQGEYREYAKGDHYFRTKGKSDVIIEGDYNRYVGGKLHSNVAGPSKIHFDGSVHEIHVGDKTIEVYGKMKEEHHAHESCWNWGDSEELFMGAHIECFLGFYLEAIFGTPCIEIKALLFSEFNIGGGLELNIGPRINIGFATTEYVLGVHNEVMAGVRNEVMTGIQNELVLGMINKVVDGYEKTFKTVRDEEHGLHMVEEETAVGAETIKVVTGQIKNSMRSLRNVMAGLHLLDEGDGGEAVIDDDEEGIEMIEMQEMHQVVEEDEDV
jgi:hypothetical protein